jgi:hypothetical protein
MAQSSYPNGGLPAGARIDYSPRCAPNGAAYAGVVFGVLWVAGLVVPIMISATSPRGVELPQLLKNLTELALWVGPLAIIFGHIGLYQALRHRELRGSLGWAIAGLVLGYLWLPAIFFLTFAGLDLLYWVTHLFR